MAELNTGNSNGKGGKVRSKKDGGKVDLTAMVDLAFLLITFFMLTTSLSKPQSMNLAMPDKDPDAVIENKTEVADDRTMTILLGSDNKLMWYFGQLQNPFVAPSQATYGKDGIRQVLLQYIKSVPARYGNDPKKGLIVIIKANDKANYKNVVDILDEMAITKVQTYAIVDISEPEVELLTSQGLN
ncbi:biopolymer transporter ExbD [Flavobacterium agricola]|uniref:Biopolymer transporter ExbD n=1 Tax=Flavobacterium agricola TaxID=2870839 RepID=A0ABY6LWU4_9FLAO|nr:biopolymer transporter ExbD [Flavobacterium agricola]UYW00631.1 biopolymer transporter ExbD [Flavobacterium agricola]